MGGSERPEIANLAECPRCFGRLLPLLVCESCNSVKVLEVAEVGPEIECDDCGASNPTHFACSGCNARFPFGEIVKPEGLTCPVCTLPLPPRADRCPNCGAAFGSAGVGRPRSKRNIRGEYGEENLREVARIPNLGNEAAEALCKAGYNRLWKIERASEKDLAKVDGVGAKSAAQIREAIRSHQLTTPRKTKEEVRSEECQCPLCGTVTSLFATKCHDCGASFGEEDLDEALQKELNTEGEKSLLEYYDDRIAENPRDVALLYARAVLLLEMGRPSDALTAIDATLQLAPGHPKALQAKALALGSAKGLGAAAQVLGETVRSFAPVSSLDGEGVDRSAGGPPPEEVEAHEAHAKADRAGGKEEFAEKGELEGEALNRDTEDALASLGMLDTIECPKCQEPQPRNAIVCTACGHRLVREELPLAAERAPTVDAQGLLDELQRAVVGEEKAPPPPLQPEIPPDVIAGKKSMAAFLSKIPGVSKRAADAVSGFFQDIEQIGHADVVQIAAIPGVAPAEARLIKVAVVQTVQTPAETWPPEELAPPPKPAPPPQVPEPTLPRPSPREGAVVVRAAPGFAGRRGLINGGGIVNGRGRVNGLVNGVGFINGVSIAEVRLSQGSLLPRYIAIGAGLLMLFSIAAGLVEQERPIGLVIDGSFDDWDLARVPVYVDGTASANPNVEIAGSSVHVESLTIFLRVRVSGRIFADPTDWETMYAFLDVDGENLTGYDLGDLGADYAVRVSGSNFTVGDAALLRFEQAGRTRDDWAGFETAGGLEAMSGGSQVEVAVPKDSLEGYSDSTMRVRFAFDDNAGETSHTLVPVGKQDGALLVEQSPETTMLGPGPQRFLTLTFHALGSVPLAVQNVQLFTRSSAVFSTITPFDLAAGSSEVRTINVDATAVPPGTLVSATVVDMSIGDSRPFAIVGPEAKAYVSQAPAGRVIDGLFDDWPTPIADSDTGPIRRPSLNILSRDANVSGSRMSLYAELGDVALEGDTTPQKPMRPTPSAPGVGPEPVPAGPRPPLVGQDYIRFYVDTDAGSSGGFDVGGFHADRLLEVRGRGGRVFDASVYRFVGGNWAQEGALEWGLGINEIEVGAALASTSFNGTQFAVVTADWFGIGDLSIPVATRGDGIGGTRSPSGPPVVMDVSGNGPFWFRDTAHPTETNCTYNKVAAPIKGPGPAQMISLSTGQTACWYADATTGQTIPSGTWETLMDLSSSGGPEYDVLIQIWNMDLNTVAETITSCLNETTTGDDIRCFLNSVEQKTLTSNQVVRLVLAHSSESGTVTIEYDDTDGTGDSRATLPIPEFPNVGATAFGVVIIALIVRSQRRRRSHASTMLTPPRKSF